MTSQHAYSNHYFLPNGHVQQSPAWPNPPILPPMSTPLPSNSSPKRIVTPLFDSDSNLSPPSNQPRFSDVTAGPPTPSNFMLSNPAPPSTAPPLPPSPYPTLDRPRAPSPSTMRSPPAHAMHSHAHSHAHPHAQSHAHPHLQSQQQPHPDPTVRRANPPTGHPSQMPRPQISSNMQQRMNNAPISSFNLPNRLTATEPPMFSGKFSFRQFESALEQHATPATSEKSTPSNNNPPSRPTTPSDGEPTSSHNVSDPDGSSGTHPSHIESRQPRDSRSQDLFDPSILSESKASDVLISSAEPSSISAAASTHIDAAGLEYDFDNLNTRIGVGTYGSVFLGRYFGEHVAIKRIRIPSAASTVSADPFVTARHAEAIRQFAREIRRYERVNHPGIVRFFGVTLPPDSSALLVTEFMQGGSLGEAIGVLRRSGTPIERASAVRIAMQACGGLRALHSHGCTWGDAKPENILLSEAIDTNGVFPQRAEARIADFGLSRSVGQTLLGDTTLAGSGQPAGTYNYMAPEVFTGKDLDNPRRAKAADIFSFGLVIYEMLTLRTPWKRRSMMEAFESVLKKERPAWPVSSDPDFHGTIPKELRDIVERCWHHDPVLRPNAEGVFEALERFSQSLMDLHDQRPVTDLNHPGNVADEAMNVQGMVQVQSTMSTVVAIGDGSVDLPNILESTNDSKHLMGDAEDDGEGSDSSVTAHPPTSRHRPSVSPVTSPERRLKVPIVDSTGSSSSLGTKSQLMPVKNMSKFLEEKGLEVISPKTGQNVLLASREDPLGSIDPSGKVGTSFEDGSSIEQFKSNFQFTTLSPKEFPKYDKQISLNEFALSTGKAAAKMIGKLERDDEDPGWSGSLPSSSCPSGLTNAMVVHNFSNKAGFDAVSTTSSASLTRKRSKRLQQIIEQAAEAFLELRRREQRTPPKQRKEAMERQAEEEAKLTLENEALKAIDDAKERNDFSAVLKKMKQHRESLAIVKASVVFLEKNCKNEGTYFDICEEGFVEELVSAATLHGSEDSFLAISFCQCVQSLSEHYDDKVGHMVRGLGAPSLLVELLEHHKTNVEVQIAGCECLAVIASSSELSRSAVATLGGPSCVYRAMTKNNASFKDVRLARAALKAIKSIAHNNERAADYLVQVAALDTVSRASEVFTSHGLESDILMALRSFAFYDGGRRNVIMSSGLKALTAIMLRNDEPEFLIQCCTFIRAITRWRDHECEEAMLQSCTSERIVELMQASNDIPGEDGAKVAWYSLNACTFLASFGSRSRQRLRLVGAIETALHMMGTHMRNARVVHAATDAVAELMKGEPEARRHAEKFDVTNRLNEALARHYDVIKTRNAVQWTLEYLLSQPPQPGVPGYAGQQGFQNVPAAQEKPYKPEHVPQPERVNNNRFWFWNRKR